MIAHVNHYHPWVIQGRALKGPVQLSLDPIDGHFLNRCLADPDRIAFAPNAMMALDLGDNPLCLPTRNNHFHPLKVAQWLRPFLTRIHEKYFCHTLSYKLHEGMDSPEWIDAQHRATSTVKEIVTIAKQIQPF